MTANNEIGVDPADRRDWRDRESEKGILFHTDAVQAVGKVPFNVNELKVDMASISVAQRCTGRRALARCTCGGETRECFCRQSSMAAVTSAACAPGTLNVPGIVGFGKAAELCMQEMAADDQRLRKLRERLERAAAQEPGRDLHQRLGGASFTAQPEHQLCVCRG